MKRAMQSGRYVRRGWTLLEMLVVLGLISAFMASLVPVTGALSRSGKQWEAALNDAGSVDAALKVLRRDVAAADRVEVLAPDHMRLGAVEWRCAETVLHRFGDDARDYDLAQRISFEDADGPRSRAVRLRVGDDAVLLLAPRRVAAEGGRR